MSYFKHGSALRGGIGWTVEDTNIESAGALDPDPPVTVMSAGALDPVTVMSAGALDLITAMGALILPTLVIDIKLFYTIIIFFLLYFLYFYIILLYFFIIYYN